VIDDGETGLLFAPGDAGDLAARLSLLLQSPETRERLGRAALRAFEQRFSTEIMAARVAETYAHWAVTSRAAAPELIA
jgi:glycosyltransferase involved in cell wall biosynthesis